jgi:HlyD family secretion protein
VYGPPGDRLVLDAEKVKPGEQFKKNDKIAELASRADRKLELDVAEIQLDETKAQLEKAKQVGRSRIAAAELELAQVADKKAADDNAFKAQLEALEKQKSVAKVQIGRLDKLEGTGVRVSDEEREQANLLLAKADAEVTALTAQWDKAKAGYKNAQELGEAKIKVAREELAEAEARAPIRSLEKKVELARRLFAATELKAPVDGTVLKVVSHDGEPTGSHQPVLYLADTGRMAVAAEVYESEVAKLREMLAKGGVTATIVWQAIDKDKPLTGRVSDESRVTRMIARNAIFAMSPREDTDRRVVEVLVDLDPASAARAAPYVGLQVEVTLAPAPREGR